MSDYNFLMEIRLLPEQLRTLNFLSRIAASQGLNLYLVGGAVRDLTYGMSNVRDLDFAVVGGLQKLLRAINAPPAKPRTHSIPGVQEEHPHLDVLEEHLDARKHAAKLVFAPGVRTEIGATHTETYSKPGGAPAISAAGIFADLKRRDFSINAMAVSLHPNSRGLLLDPANGAADIERRELRALHSRSFLEDPSRIYRLIRLGFRLNFKPDAKTQAWLDHALEQKAWQSLNAEQQSREIQEILREEEPGRLLKLLGERGLLEGLDNHLSAKKLPYAQFEKIRAAAHNLPAADPFLLYLSALSEKLPSAYRAKFGKKVLGDSKLAQAAARLELEAHKVAQDLKGRKGNTPSEVYRLLSAVPSHVLLYMLVNLQQAPVQTRLKNFLFKYPQVRAKLPREELLSLGIEPGPKFEEILEKIFIGEINGKIRTPSQVTKALRTIAGVSAPPVHPAPEKAAHPKNAKEAVAVGSSKPVRKKR
jgi:tRNA nucleotidyltransferase (CCA-adding enzyme)